MPAALLFFSTHALFYRPLLLLAEVAVELPGLGQGACLSGCYGILSHPMDTCRRSGARHGPALPITLLRLRRHCTCGGVGLHRLHVPHISQYFYRAYELGAAATHHPGGLSAAGRIQLWSFTVALQLFLRPRFERHSVVVAFIRNVEGHSCFSVFAAFRSSYDVTLADARNQNKSDRHCAHVISTCQPCRLCFTEI